MGLEKRLIIAEKRVDASLYSTEYTEWLSKAVNIRDGLEEPSEVPVEDLPDDTGLTLVKKLELGLIEEEEYYEKTAPSIGLPPRPSHNWVWAKTVIDLAEVLNISELPDKVGECVVYYRNNQYTVYKVSFEYLLNKWMEFYNTETDGRGNIVEVLPQV